MSDWTAGYVADIGYTYGYYPELNPVRMPMALLNGGLVFPEVEAACELGFGQGLSTNIHAAASGVSWYGTDFNPAQAGFAQELAQASGVQAKLYDEAFNEFCARTDLPDFDFIALHGIWSWISDSNRQVIVDFLRRKLKVGGVLYVSYNTMPGWANFAPMRHLMTQHADILGTEGRGIVNRIEGALDFANKLMEAKPLYAAANPQVAERLKRLQEQNRHYLAHEFFNRDWHPMHFSTMGDWLQAAKVNFACSAHFLDHIDAISLTAAQQDFLKEIPDVMLRQSVRDFMTNSQFRRDYWVKGRRNIGAMDRIEKLMTSRIVLTSPRNEIPLKVAGPLGDVSLLEDVYTPILDCLANHEVKSLGQLLHELKGQKLEFQQLVQATMIMIGAGHIAPVQDDAVIARTKAQTDKLNVHLMDKARSNMEINHLASPVTGGGVSISRFQQLFLSALKQGKKQSDEWADYTWNFLVAQSQKIVKDGKPLQTPDENIAELRTQAREFTDKRLALLKNLKVV